MVKPLPRKKTPQEWVDIVLPGFEQPPEQPAKQKSKKDADDAVTKIVYRRYKTGRKINCADCVEDAAAGKGGGIRDANYSRTLNGKTTYLCFQHRAESANRELLNGGRG